MMKQLATYIMLPMLLLVTSCGKRGDGMQNELKAPLDSLFGTMFQQSEPGAIVLVAQGDSIVYCEGFGIADLATGARMTDTTLVNICSISKQFSAIALLKLQEEGLLSLDDSLPKFFPEFKPPFYNRITLRHLLSHTSGIPDSRPRTREAWNEYVKHHSSHFSNVRDFKLYSLTEESTAYLTDLKALNFEPGAAYEYENPTFQLVLPIVEQVTGMGFTEWMDSAIFRPAGMDRTLYFNPAHQQGLSHAYRPTEGPNRYKIYRSADGKWEECDYGEASFFPTEADGGLYTTALDFLAWERALFAGKIVNEESLKEAFTPYIGTDIPFTDYGLGFFLEHTPKGEKIYHTGDNGGYYTVEAYYPADDLFYLVFANRPDWDRERTVEKIDSILLSTGRLSGRGE